MKKVLFASAAAMAFGLFGTVSADDHGEMSEGAKQFKEGCKQYQVEHGGNSDCKCLAKKVDSDEEFAAEMMTVMGPEDIENLSEATLEKISACEMKDEEAAEEM
ncbi:hypothetical protein [Aquisalinus flavus]|uniref:Uncharacterized protein n=1 Tax=Aquisalinus flavus TaxID=1526572 RepID=A0A8J2V6L2_9PROT|nr:hypothetical protein [Aquisalinus flavus]MBD0425614.1 hypothetical protein [Aquisalinus flavus]UNE48767.1 hypothetical protein FF099_12255 [Aquisalinus flavus]GGD14616.1 hypothetical protein GCM10011342_24280 [Aquisalinus flavus]